MAAGRRLFADHAFADVSTQQIVAAAGVTRGALYHQFSDKAALFEAVYEQVEEELVASIAEAIATAAPDDQLEAMRHGVRLFLDHCAAPDVHRIVLVNAPAVLGWERWREVGARYGLGVIEAMLTRRPSPTACCPSNRCGLRRTCSSEPSTRRRCTCRAPRTRRPRNGTCTRSATASSDGIAAR